MGLFDLFRKAPTNVVRVTFRDIKEPPPRVHGSGYLYRWPRREIPEVGDRVLVPGADGPAWTVVIGVNDATRKELAGLDLRDAIRIATPAEAAAWQAPRPAVRTKPSPVAPPPERWYAASDEGGLDRFMPAEPGGLPPLRLIPYTTSDGEDVLMLCEDSTGLLVGPKDRRLQRAGIFSIAVQGESYNKAACRAGDFSPGAPIELVREPDNEHDPNAIAVHAKGRRTRAGYVNKGKARSLAKIMDKGTPLRVISTRGTAAGRVCEQIAILAASPEIVDHLLSPRPDRLPTPAHLR